MTTKTTTPETKTTKPREPWYELAQDTEGQWHWCLWAGNGQQLACSPKGYTEKKHAIQALRLVAPAANSAKVVAKAGDDD